MTSQSQPSLSPLFTQVTLLYVKLCRSGQWRISYTVDFSGYVTFKAAHDLLLGLALGATTRNIAAGALVYSHAHDAYQVQSAVSVAVTAPVEAVSYDLTRGRLYGRDPAQTGEGGFAPQPLKIVSGHDQQRRSVVGTDACQTDQLRGDLPNQPIELCVQLGDLCRESLVTASQRTERELGCRRYVTRVICETEACSRAHEF